jgi:hypothetical protein
MGFPTPKLARCGNVTAGPAATSIHIPSSRLLHTAPTSNLPSPSHKVPLITLSVSCRQPPPPSPARLHCTSLTNSPSVETARYCCSTVAGTACRCRQRSSNSASFDTRLRRALASAVSPSRHSAICPGRIDRGHRRSRAFLKPRSPIFITIALRSGLGAPASSTLSSLTASACSSSFRDSRRGILAGQERLISCFLHACLRRSRISAALHVHLRAYIATLRSTSAFSPSCLYNQPLA